MQLSFFNFAPSIKKNVFSAFKTTQKMAENYAICMKLGLKKNTHTQIFYQTKTNLHKKLNFRFPACPELSLYIQA
jgi:hypothetical protein